MNRDKIIIVYSSILLLYQGIVGIIFNRIYISNASLSSVFTLFALWGLIYLMIKNKKKTNNVLLVFLLLLINLFYLI